MKTSIAISVLILATAAGLVWKIDQRPTAAQMDERRLAAGAKQLGILGDDARPTRSVNRARADLDASAKQLAVEYTAESKKWESVAIMDDATGERYADIHRRIEALDPSRLRTFITDVLTDKDVHEIMRAERAVKLLPILAKKDPQGALTLFKEYHAAIKISPGAGNVIPECLGAWAKNDSHAAVAWIAENTVEFPHAMEQSRGFIFRSAAQKDPELAFSLIEHLKLDSGQAYGALHTIVTAAKTDEERNITLSAFRQFRNASEDNKEIAQAVDQTFGYFCWSFSGKSFETTTRWINGANLSPWELDRFCSRMSLNYDGHEPAQWIEWMSATFPLGKGDEHIIDLVRSWTNKDYEAAGKWLASALEGPTKNAAIRSYALTIYKQDPETAMQWIMTLPPGRDRDETLKTIHMNWPNDDPTRKEAFKMEHGIK